MKQILEYKGKILVNSPHKQWDKYTNGLGIAPCEYNTIQGIRVSAWTDMKNSRVPGFNTNKSLSIFKGLKNHVHKHICKLLKYGIKEDIFLYEIFTKAEVKVVQMNRRGDVKTTLLGYIITYTETNNYIHIENIPMRNSEQINNLLTYIANYISNKDTAVRE